MDEVLREVLKDFSYMAARVSTREDIVRKLSFVREYDRYKNLNPEGQKLVDYKADKLEALVAKSHDEDELKILDSYLTLAEKLLSDVESVYSSANYEKNKIKGPVI